MPTIRSYVRRKPRAAERDRIEDASRVLSQAHRNLRFHPDNNTSTVAITLRNRANPNGFHLSIDARGQVKVDRFINIAWAKKNGYRDY